MQDHQKAEASYNCQAYSSSFSLICLMLIVLSIILPFGYIAMGISGVSSDSLVLLGVARCGVSWIWHG